EDALLAVAEPALRYGQVAVLEADSGAIEIRHTNILEHEAGDFGRPSAQHQCALAFACDAVEYGRAGFDREIGDVARALHRALRDATRGDRDSAPARAYRIDRGLQPGVA